MSVLLPAPFSPRRACTVPRATASEAPRKTETELNEVKNLGEKSIDEIKGALATFGLSLGMRIDPNVLGALGRGPAR